MKASDFIVEFFEKKKINHIFGYPGGMVTHLMDSLSKSNSVKTHIVYHEQAASFAACGYGQIKNTPSVVFSTSGPGATNLLTGICNAWFDSIPAIFITGQVNVYEGKGALALKQKGFQETDIISIVKSVVKYAAYISDASMLEAELNKAYDIALDGRMGPVLLDIPMNIFRAQIEPQGINSSVKAPKKVLFSNEILDMLKAASRPCLLFGNGMHTQSGSDVEKLVNKMNMPVVTSMPAVDILPYENKYMYGFIGAYGNRTANTIIEKSDLIISLGSRLDGRQTGADKLWFATNARLIRIDIDSNEFENKIKENELQINCKLCDIIPYLIECDYCGSANESWLSACNSIKQKLDNYDAQNTTDTVSHISDIIPYSYNIVTDVGQNQVWTAQAYKIGKNQRVLFSAGLGAMGYSLPAAIGAYYASGVPTVSINGDGGIQMNIQELQTVAREQIPIKIIVINNNSLGMIRHFQEMYFDSNYTMTLEKNGYSAPDFEAIAKAYKIDSMKYFGCEDDEKLCNMIKSPKPALIEIIVNGYTYTKPKSVYNKPLSEQLPLLSDELINEIKKI